MNFHVAPRGAAVHIRDAKRWNALGIQHRAWNGIPLQLPIRLVLFKMTVNASAAAKTAGECAAEHRLEHHDYRGASIWYVRYRTVKTYKNHINGVSDMHSSMTRTCHLSRMTQQVDQFALHQRSTPDNRQGRWQGKCGRGANVGKNNGIEWIAEIGEVAPHDVM